MLDSSILSSPSQLSQISDVIKEYGGLTTAAILMKEAANQSPDSPDIMLKLVNILICIDDKESAFQQIKLATIFSCY